MSKRFMTGALACTIALAAHPATEAGQHEIKRVSIEEDFFAFKASGNVADVHNCPGGSCSDNAIEMIKCSIRATSGFVSARCFARDDKGRTLQCTTSDEVAMRPLFAIGPDSTIFFSTSKQSAECLQIEVTNGSTSGPKRPSTPELESEAIDTTGQGELMP